MEMFLVYFVFRGLLDYFVGMLCEPENFAILYIDSGVQSASRVVPYCICKR